MFCPPGHWFFLQEIRFVVTRGRGWGEGELVKVAKSYKLLVLSSGDVMYNMVTVVSADIWHIGKLREWILRILITRRNFSFLFTVSVWDDGWYLNLLWSFHSLRKSNHYAIRLTLTQWCMPSSVICLCCFDVASQCCRHIAFQPYSLLDLWGSSASIKPLQSVSFSLP